MNFPLCHAGPVRHKGKARLRGRVYLIQISLTLADPKISSHPSFFSPLFGYCFKLIRQQTL